MEPDTRNIPEQEPTVLDLFKSVTRDWASFFNFIRSLWDAQRRDELNQTLALEAQRPVVEQVAEPTRAVTFPWRSVIALVLALGAQFMIEPPNRQWTLALALYLAALGIALWAYRTDEWHLPTLPAAWQMSDPLTMRMIPLVLSVIFAAIAFVLFGEGYFRLINTALWVLSVALLAYSLWVNVPKPEPQSAPAFNESNFHKKWQKDGLLIAISDDAQFIWKWLRYVLVIAAFGLAVFFRLYQLDTVPIEPFSDHAEKILDVYEVSQGQTHIFFERNTGREAIQMYWTLLVLNVFGTGFSFFSLKLGTVLLGILTLPFVYQLGKEYGNERVALFALFLFGIASWPNIISRIGLRFPLYPLFVAPTLLYLTRGLRTRNRNDFILAGIFLGLGLHGYSPFRMMPIFTGVMLLIYFLHQKTKQDRQQTIFWFLVIVIVSLFIFSPLLRYWMSNPANFGYRAFSRLGDVETPLPGPAWQIFLSNLSKGLLMFNWDDGEIWVHSVTHRPALDLATAALFLLGIAFLIVRYVRQRDWRDLTLLASIPVLIMPSVLSLAYPGENPALNRAGGASVTAILIGALALDGLVSSFGSAMKRKVIAYALTLVMFSWVAYSNYDIVFNKFKSAYTFAAWNTSEMGRVVKDFGDTYGQTDTVWIVPYPYWVDTRLPGVWAGVPDRDFALFPERLPESLSFPAPKMFLFWNQDAETEKILRELYPNGKLSRYTSAFEGKDFFIYLVEQ